MFRLHFVPLNMTYSVWCSPSCRLGSTICRWVQHPAVRVQQSALHFRVILSAVEGSPGKAPHTRSMREYIFYIIYTIDATILLGILQKKIIFCLTTAFPRLILVSKYTPTGYAKGNIRLIRVTRRSSRVTMAYGKRMDGKLPSCTQHSRGVISSKKENHYGPKSTDLLLLLRLQTPQAHSAL